ncbi:ABC transporter permease [Microbacterium soli]|uniref:ABC transporter permease n=1 Tax=Microbacterium soli TaxID=446075 RepID=A0ABP7N5F2_9MICO
MVSLVVQRLALVILVVGAWEMIARWLDARSIPSVAPVFDASLHTVGTDRFWSALGGTMQSWAIGMLIASGVGVALGLMIGASPLLTRVTGGMIDFLRTVPAIMLVPLVVLVLGATAEMKILLIALSALWPILVQSTYAIGHVDPVSRDTATVFRLGRVQRILRLYLPSALPLIATGIRVAATVALLISVGAEIITSAPGIGHEILLSQANGSPARAFVYVLLSGALGVAINLTFLFVERRVIFWHGIQQRKAAS